MSTENPRIKEMWEKLNTSPERKSVIRCKEYIERSCMQDANEFFLRCYRKKKRVGGLIRYCKGILAFTKFEELSVLNREDRTKIINHWIARLDDNNIKPKTISGHLEGIRALLSFLENPLTEKEIALLEVPTAVEIPDEIMTTEQMRKFVMTARPRIKLLALIGKSSGMRIGEMLSVRISDIKFDESPVRIILKSDYTKGVVAREVFIDDEAKETLNDWIKQNPRSSSDLVFFEKLSRHAVRIIRSEYNNALHQAGLDRKIEGHKYFVFHIHTLRKWFWTNALQSAKDGIPELTIRALMGHGTYLKTYNRFPLERRQEEYKKIAKYLKIFGPTTDPKQQRIQSIIDTAKLLGVDGTKLQEIEGMLQSHDLNDELFVTIANKITKKEINKQFIAKKITERELIEYLNAGFEIVGNSNGYIYIRKEVSAS